jgi:pimeloyl-ACP methyl ester carboxylesterase
MVPGSKRERVRVGGRTVHYRTAGSGEPLVLVHGLAGSTRSWRYNLAELARSHRVYLVDLPGFGAMSRPRATFALPEAAGWLYELLDALKVGPVHLLGHSMGGYLSVRLAVERPEMVRRLVLAAPAGIPAGRSLPGYLLPLLNTGRMPPLELLPHLLGALRAGLWTLLQTARELLVEDVRPELGRLRQPVLVLWGAEDPILPVEAGEVFRREIPDSRLLIIPRAGHLLMRDRPAEFNAAVRDFLAGG